MWFIQTHRICLSCFFVLGGLQEETALRSKAMLHAVPLAVSMASFASLNIQKQESPRDMLQFPVILNGF